MTEVQQAICKELAELMGYTVETNSGGSLWGMYHSWIAAIGSFTKTEAECWQANCPNFFTDWNATGALMEWAVWQKEPGEKDNWHFDFFINRHVDLEKYMKEPGKTVILEYPACRICLNFGDDLYARSEQVNTNLQEALVMAIYAAAVPVVMTEHEEE